MQQIAFRAKLGYYKTVSARLVYIVAFYHIGVLQIFKNLNLVVQHLKRLFAILLQLYDLDGTLLVIPRRVAFIDFAAVA